MIGTGIGGINFGPQDNPGNYTVTASGNCGSSEMLGSVDVTISINPETYNVTGGGYYCEYLSGVSIDLSNSEMGVNYELILNGTATGTVIEGTGSPISFPDVNVPGWYEVLAYSDMCSDTMSGSVEVGIYPVPVANAGDDISIPYGTYTTLNGTATGGSGSYTYQWEPAALLVNPTVPNPTTVNLTSTTIFTFKVTDVNDCFDSDDIIVTVTGGPLGVMVTADETSLCEGAGTQLHALASGGSGNYTYSWASMPPGFTSTDPNPSVMPSMTTQYSVTVNDGYNLSQGSVTITVKPLPDIQAGADQLSIPYGSWTTLHAVAGGGTGPYTYQWSPPNLVLDPSSPDPETKHLEYTVMFTVTVTDAGTGCIKSATVTVEVYGGPLQIVSVDANPDVMCNTGAPVQLSGQVAGGTENYTYLWTSNPPGFDQDILNPVAYPNQNTTYILTVDDGNTTASNSVDVVVHELPTAYAGQDDTIQYGTWTLLNGSASGGSGSYVWHWTPENLLVNPEVMHPQTVSMTGSAIFTLKATDYYGCWSEDQMTLYVVGGPLGVNAYAQPSEICQYEQSELNALAFGGSEEYTYTWKDPSGNIIGNFLKMVVAPLVTTTYSIEVSDGYNSSNNTVTLTVDPLPVIDLIPEGANQIAPDTISACVYDTIILDAGNPGCQYIWSDQSWGQTMQVGTTGIGFEIQTRWVTVTNTTTGCHSTDSITIFFSFSECTGISKPEKKVFISIYPNPTTGVFNVEVVGKSGEYEIEVMDIQGNDVWRQKNGKWNKDKEEKDLIRIDLSGYSEGVYLIKIFNRDFLYINKLIRQ
jgi:hypothetical protein